MKDNKFLTGFLIVTLLGAGALGFMLFKAKSAHSEATAAFEDKVSTLKTLQGTKPFPEDANYKKVLELQKTHQEAIVDLQKRLAKAELPLEPLSPAKFQDELNQAVKRVKTLAQSKNTKIENAEKLSLGFELYLSQPPKPEAAAPLGRMLKAIEIVVTDLLNTAPTEIKDVKRAPLPEEGLGPKVAATPTPKPGTVGAKKVVEEKPLVTRYPFDIEFVAHEQKARQFINAIVANKKQFLIPASIKIENSKQEGPSKAAVAAPPEPTPEGGTPTPAAAKFVFGEETLAVSARIELVDFADPPAEKTTDQPAKPAPAK